MSENEQTFPTAADEQGFFYASADEKEAEILTREYDNGSTVKKTKLRNGKEAIVRQLNGRESAETRKRLTNDRTLDFETTNLSLSVKIDGQMQPPEYYLDDLRQPDYIKLMGIHQELNF